MAAEQGIALVMERILDPTRTDLEQFEPIYVGAFSPSDLAPLEKLVEAIRKGDLLFFAAREGEGGDIVGFALVLPLLPGTSAANLTYFVVDSRKRSQGIGGELFRFTVRYLTENTSADALMWEVMTEDPNDANALQSRRIRFYERLGSRVVKAGPYVLPDFEEGIVGARLMWIPLGQRQHEPDKTEIIAWIRAIFADGFPNRVDLGEQFVSDILWPA